MKFEEKSKYLERNKEYFSRFKELSDDEKEELKSDISTHYFDKEWGLKLVARNVVGISYTQCRHLFPKLGLEFRKGRSVATKMTSEFRRNKAIAERDAGYGIFDPELKRFAKTDVRGCQGYYLNKSTGKYTWLRSAYEYIFAKFLDSINATWSNEERYFILSDGTKYMPDFFVYKNGELKTIVEIKGYFDNRAYKVDLLRDEYFNGLGVRVMFVRDIKKFLIDGGYHKELECWKKIRKSKEFVSSLST